LNPRQIHVDDVCGFIVDPVVWHPFGTNKTVRDEKGSSLFVRLRVKLTGIRIPLIGDIVNIIEHITGVPLMLPD
jgi:hypothetical protein